MMNNCAHFPRLLNVFPSSWIGSAQCSCPDSTGSLLKLSIMLHDKALLVSFIILLYDFIHRSRIMRGNRATLYKSVLWMLDQKTNKQTGYQTSTLTASNCVDLFEMGYI